MKSCSEMRELRNAHYTELLNHIESKILSNLTEGYIFIDENETKDFNVTLLEGRWINLLEEKGYKVDYCNNYVVPTIKISGW